MAHFNFVISQNAKWGHAGFYIDCHRMTVPENILLQKSTVKDCLLEDHASAGVAPEGDTVQYYTHNIKHFYRAMLCIRGTSHGPVSVRLSVCLSVCLSVRHKSVFY